MSRVGILVRRLLQLRPVLCRRSFTNDRSWCYSAALASRCLLQSPARPVGYPPLLRYFSSGLRANNVYKPTGHSVTFTRCSQYRFTEAFHRKSFLRSFSVSVNSYSMSSMPLGDVVSLLEGFAPLSLAASWDNVGLLLEPTPPHRVSCMLLTNDLTEAVLMEAISKKVDFILSYHPPIFVPFKQLTMESTKERIVVRAAENRIAIYSAHTCYDAVEGGVNDWLLEAFGGIRACRPVEPSPALQTPSGDEYSLSFLTYDANGAMTVQKMAGVSNVTSMTLNKGMVKVHMTCTKSSLGDVVVTIQQMSDADAKSIEITQLAIAPLITTGMGRTAGLNNPVSTREIIQKIKTHLKLDHVQVAMGQGKSLDSKVFTVAVCAGSGSSVLRGVPADVYLTGEMSHHDILAAVSMGVTVITCNHSNTERGFLYVIQKKLTRLVENRVDRFKVLISDFDKDPLEVM
ncbi:NIF3-like protein 1 [Diadema setosum]|uniref:NIF3-like protein 1 n=1 Tax=Diadema setosum TaxID=31175 RepID=UPI003B3B7D5A